MTPDYEIAEGDSLPLIEAEFEDVNGEPVVLLEGDVVTLRIQRSGGRDDPINVECEVVDEKVQSDPLNALAPGRYEARFVVTFVAGGQLSWPNSDPPIYIKVNPNFVTEEESS
jgi:hypothetical protein